MSSPTHPAVAPPKATPSWTPPLGASSCLGPAFASPRRETDPSCLWPPRPSSARPFRRVWRCDRWRSRSLSRDARSSRGRTLWGRWIWGVSRGLLVSPVLTARQSRWSLPPPLSHEELYPKLLVAPSSQPGCQVPAPFEVHPSSLCLCSKVDECLSACRTLSSPPLALAVKVTTLVVTLVVEVRQVSGARFISIMLPLFPASILLSVVILF